MEGGTELIDAYSKVVTGVVAKVGPAVVHVRVKKKIPRRGPGPAHRAGLKEGDIIISLGGEHVTSVDDIHRRLTREAIGRSMGVVLLRDWTKRLEMSIVPAESPVL
jgi:C-terminal processing protease CtpA/Prc